MINQSTDPLAESFRFRSIGPASMGGRIDDIAVSESDPSIIYVGYAVGGVFKSDNNGTTFKPVFETYGTASIGDIAIHPTNPNIVYVGTGEANNRQTSSFGDGIYKTTDGGKTFTNIGLKDTQTIARIVIDPKNPETVYVASPGHLFGPNPERGIFKTTDGGKTWNKIKFIDDDTGFTDIAIDPSNSNILYAASYQRRRSGCCFNGGGPGSALWKTTDAGKTWTKLTAHGLPPGTYGRIALDVSRSNPNVVYVQIEAGVDRRCRLPARGADPNASTEATPPGAAAVTAPGTAPPAAGVGARTRSSRPAAGGRRWRRRRRWPRRLQLVQQRRARTAASLAARRRACRRRPSLRSIPRAAACSGPTTRATTLDARQQLQRAADVLQPAARRSVQRQGDLRRRVCRSRSRSTAARRSRRSTRPAATANRATSISTRSGSIRRTRST